MIDKIYRQFLFLAPALVMSAWATVMLHVLFSGQITRLLAAPFRPYLFAAALILLGLSIAHLLFYQAPQGALGLTRWHRFRQTLRWVALLLPVLAAAFFSPNALSRTTLANRASSPNADTLAMPTYSSSTDANLALAAAADPNQPAAMEITEIITIAASPKQIAAFEGRKVNVVGIYVPGQGVRLMRGIMWCCAADIQPVFLTLTGSTDFSGKTDDPDHPAWVSATGTLHYVTHAGKTLPEVKVDSVQATAEPDEPYLSP